jgi:hypothetical protein
MVDWTEMAIKNWAGWILPVADVLDVLRNGGVSSDPVPVHQGDELTLLNINQKSEGPATLQLSSTS